MQPVSARFPSHLCPDDVEISHGPGSEHATSATDYQYCLLAPIASIQVPFREIIQVDLSQQPSFPTQSDALQQAQSTSLTYSLEDDSDFPPGQPYITLQPISSETAVHCLSQPVATALRQKQQIEFNFVNADGNPRKLDGASKRKIRVYAARHTYAQKRLREHKAAVQNIPILPRNTTEDSILAGTDSSTQYETGTGNNTRASNVYSINASATTMASSFKRSGVRHPFESEPPLRFPISAWSPTQGVALDPCAGSVVPMTTHMRERIHHLLEIHGPTTNPRIYGNGNATIRPWSCWIDIARTDATALYALVTQASVHRLMLQSQALNLDGSATSDQLSATSEANFYLFKTMRLLQDKFGNATEALSNASVFAATVLTACVGSAGHKEQLYAHYNGMVKMVQLRGGIDTFPRAIAYQLSRVDSNGAWAQHQEPRFPFYSTRFKSPGAVGFDIPGSEDNSVMVKQLKIFLTPKALTIACNLFYLTYLLGLHYHEPNRFGANQCEYFEDTFASAQHALASLPYPALAPRSPVALHQQHCWRIAALIYFNTALRYSPSPAMLPDLTGRLIEALHETDTSTAWHPFEDVLLWIYFMGYVACEDPYVGSKDVGEKMWFMEEARRVTGLVGLRTSDEMKARMKHVLFRDISHDESLRLLWKDFS